MYRLTAAGAEELEARRDEIGAVATEAVQSARALATEIRDDVRSSVRDLRRELKDAVRDVKREERRVGRDVSASASLRRDLESFAADVLAAARRHHLDGDRLRQVSDALLDAREAIFEVLDGQDSRRAR